MIRSSRREILRQLGLGVGMLPLLPRDYARAADQPRLRLLIVLQTGGTDHSSFWPNPGSLANITLPPILSPLETHKQGLLLVDGIRMSNFLDHGDHGAGHENYASTFTGTPGFEIEDGGKRYLGGSATPDQLIATELAKTTPLPYKSLHLAAQVDDKEGREFLRRAFWKGSNQSVTPEHNPANAAASLFMGKPTAADPAAMKLLKAKQSLLDFVGSDLERYGKRVGKDAAVRIDQHLQSYRELELRLKSNALAPAGVCEAPGVPAGLRLTDPLQYKKVMDAQMDIIAAAFACDATRVATLQLTNASGTHTVFPEIKDISTVNSTFDATNNLGLRNYHDIQHAGGPDKVKVDRWYMEQFAGLIARLKALPEGNSSVFDNTVILWTNHMGDGGAHSSDRLPWVIAGSCGGYYKLGQCLKAKTNTNNVLVSLFNAMRFPRDRYGDDYGAQVAGLSAA